MRRFNAVFFNMDGGRSFCRMNPSGLSTGDVIKTDDNKFFEFEKVHVNAPGRFGVEHENINFEIENRELAIFREVSQ